MLSIVDVIILLFLLLGAILGFKKGIIKSVVSFVGTILVVVLSFMFKNSLSVFLYTYFPFFNFGIAVLNILIYEAIAFLILFSVFSIILKIVIKISGIIETLLKFTIVLGIPSKILGAIFGFLEMYLFIFVTLFILAEFNIASNYILDSKLASMIIGKTPFISNTLDNSYQALKGVVDLNKEYLKNDNQDKLNQDGLDILLKYQVISVDNASKLINKNKLKIKDANIILAKYEKSDK